MGPGGDFFFAGSDGAIVNSSMMLVAVCLSVVVASGLVDVPSDLLQNLGAIAVWTLPPAKTPQSRVVQCVLAEHLDFPAKYLG